MIHVDFHSVTNFITVATNIFITITIRQLPNKSERKAHIITFTSFQVCSISVPTLFAYLKYVYYHSPVLGKCNIEKQVPKVLHPQERRTIVEKIPPLTFWQLVLQLVQNLPWHRQPVGESTVAGQIINLNLMKRFGLDFIDIQRKKWIFIHAYLQFFVWFRDGQ